MFYYVYILRSLKDGKLYIGHTNDLRRRIAEHNKGNNFSTKGRLPLILIHYEAFRNQDDSQLRERFFKSGWGRQFIQKALKNYFQSEKFRRG